MKLTKIVIDDYNSIKDPQTIDINGEIVTFLGKNGSGKSNLLRAIRLFFNPSEFLGYQREASYHAFLELSEQEIKEIDASLEYHQESRQIEIAFMLGESERKGVYSPALNQAIRRIHHEIERIQQVIHTDLVAYQEQLNQYLENSPTIIQEGLNENQIAFTEIMQHEQKKILDTIHKLKRDEKRVNSLISSQVNGELIFYKNEENLRLETNSYEASLKISYQKIVKSTLQDNRNQLNFAQLRSVIKEINQTHQALVSRMDNHLAYFVFLTRQLAFIFYKGSSNQLTTASTPKSKGILDRIQKTMQKRCFYLDNEQSLMFKHQVKKDLSYQGFKPRQHIIMESFYQYCLERKLVDKSEETIDLAKYDDGKKQKMKRYFEHFINESLPRFDLEMLDTIQVEIEQNQFQLLVVEKSGDRVDFDDTSLGRRWFFTYLFIKKVLKRGDVFIIDEPASFLHPEAQKTILRELEELAKNGIHIFITTHSPYMISHNYSVIYFVSMTTRGTVIEKGEQQNYSLLKDTIGEVGFSNLLLNLTKKYIIVEGPGDLACIKAFIRIFELDESQYEVWYLEGAYNIRRIKRFLENNRVNSVHLLDYDMRKNYKYEPDDIIFVGEDTKEKSIEGLFHSKDKQRYFRKNKLAHDKIVHATKDTIEKETYRNFKALFQRMGIVNGDMT